MNIHHLSAENIQKKANHGSVSQRILDIVMQHSHFIVFNQQIKMTKMVTQAFDLHLEKISNAIKNEDKISFILPAFPAKSPNREKTLSALPDMGEYLALSRLNTMCQKISEIYHVGAKVIICSSGRVFSDLISVDDFQVTLYGLNLLSMVEENNFHHIDMFNLEDAFTSMNYDEMRSNLCELFPKNVDDIRHSIAIGDTEKNHFNGIHRFLLEDLNVIQNEDSNMQNRQEVKKLAFEVVHRSCAWNSYVEGMFPASVRLSIYPQRIETKKLGIQLVPCEDVWGTPWHNVPLFNGKSFSLVTHKVAQAMGAKLVESSHGYRYFEITTS